MNKPKITLEDFNDMIRGAWSISSMLTFLKCTEQEDFITALNTLKSMVDYYDSCELKNMFDIAIRCKQKNNSNMIDWKIASCMTPDEIDTFDSEEELKNFLQPFKEYDKLELYSNILSCVDVEEVSEEFLSKILKYSMEERKLLLQVTKEMIENNISFSEEAYKTITNINKTIDIIE